MKAKESAKANGDPKKELAGSTAIFQPPYSHEPANTAITPEMLEKIVTALTTAPEGFRVLPKLKRILLERRKKVWQDGGPYDWGFAEALAFGSLLLEKTPVRLSGQDCRRGTFSHRLSVLYDEVTRDRHIPLNNLDSNQAKLCVYNSPLSEYAVLGFDYGYSMDFPSMLCLWEAQFGDFANGAQIIIDQFISSAESKWQRPSSIVMLLPHGYEGQGPEHSSARLERFLQLCAEENMQVCNLTTPAQYFHALRRQIHRGYRKPLVIMTPKSLLRLEAAVSKTEDFTNSRFYEILADNSHADPKTVERVIFCSGKVYYDLLSPSRKERPRRQGGHRPHRAALSALWREVEAHRGAVQEGENLRLVPGGAAEHGRMVLHRLPPRRPAPGSGEIRRSQALGQSRRRLNRDAQERTGRSGQRRLHPVTLATLFPRMSTEVKVPAVGESITSGLLSTWHKKDGEAVSAGDILFTLETDNLHRGQRDRVRHAEDHGARGRGGQDRPGRRHARAGRRRQSRVQGPESKVGKTKTRARGRRGGKARARGGVPEPEPAPAAPTLDLGPSTLDQPKAVTRKKLSPLRRKIATQLVAAQHNAAILTTFNECDMSAVIQLRKDMQEDSRRSTASSSASCPSSSRRPSMRSRPSRRSTPASTATSRSRIHYYDIGVAVGTEKGLIVPVVRDCDTKSFADIERDLANYAVKAREGKIGLEDLQGGVFTVSNGGVYGSLMSTPILNPPQSGILGMHKTQDRPVAVNGQVVIRPMMYLALSYDHRVVDGKEAVTFLVRVKECIENPMRLLLGT